LTTNTVNATNNHSKTRPPSSLQISGGRYPLKLDLSDRIH